jgi:4-amino-4-deoxy-L-arabinose transferase-like glycosyltransferase
VAGAAAVLLAVLMLAVHWYGARTGWQVLTSARWLALVTVVSALGLVLTQLTRPAPAVPATMSLIVTVIGALNGLWLLYRVAISAGADQRAGSWVGLLSAWLIVAGGFWSLRREGISSADGPREIPVVRLGGERSGAN